MVPSSLVLCQCRKYSAIVTYVVFIVLTTSTACVQLGTAPGGLVVERSPGVREVVGSIPCRVIPKTLKMVLDASLLSARHLKDRSRTYGRFPRC